jgi:hypothetical protein
MSSSSLRRGVEGVEEEEMKVGIVEGEFDAIGERLREGFWV